ncbi:MAG: anaerobic ribonucleoside-triphosphate reductase activating protein [Gracilibacteraceae bacterium]|jgi:anaerobic ribonucleoside-triphosphate reductase activating protein|nr:anaerobic ribonucleoside-triphosphate reductase activating protein [Gracilibacteraceae bacterium]
MTPNTPDNSAARAGLSSEKSPCEERGQKIRLSGIAEESVVDGPGIRSVFFVQGCPHGCHGCHNPHTHAFDGGYEADVDDLAVLVKGNPLISGVTFSGGEPLCQAVPLAVLARKIKETGLEIALYTGYTWEGLLAENDKDRLELLRLCDVLIDGRFVEDKRDLALVFRGSSNQRILDVQRSFRSQSAVLVTDPAWLDDHPEESQVGVYQTR